VKLIFVSGPYRADTTEGVINNIAKARKAAIKLWREGWAVFCPHSNTALFDGLADDSVWLKGDLEILKRCDAIYMLKAWSNSTGSKVELKLAEELGLEVIYQ